MQQEELITDDEAIRERGFTDGVKKQNGLIMRPVTALSLSWMQRNKMFDDDFGDMLQRTAAFAFLHTEPKEEIRGIVNNFGDFMSAVDDWIDSKIKHHTELEPIAEMMNEALENYMAATTTAAHPNDPQKVSIKN